VKITKSTFLDYLIKILLGTIIYFFFRYVSIPEEEGIFDLDSNSLFYYIFTLFLIFIFWEINDRSYRYFSKRFERELFTKKNVFKYAGFVILLSAVVLLAGSYFLQIHLSSFLGCEWTKDPYQLVWETYTQSLIIGFLFNLVYFLLAFAQYKRNADLLEEKIKKENLSFQYESLRNQIDPHFLFNSFSVLNSLIQQDQKLATEFLSHLSEIYRYLLDNKENKVSSLKKELEFVDSYLFLMKIRHDGCIDVNIQVDENDQTYSIPTVSLQMLVENAIKHNSFNEKKPLQLSIFTDNGHLVVKNELNIRKTAKISAGIGLQNIQKRYKLHTSKKVVIDKSETHFTVKLPLL
jgi:two-component system LytT family sensor kinase